MTLSAFTPGRRGVLTFGAASAAALTLAACGRGSDAGSASGRIVLAVSTQTNPFFVQLVDGAKAEAKAQGLTLDVQDASDDSAKQADQIANAITQGADVVIVNPTDSDAVAASVKALNAASIPVVAVDRSASDGEVASFIASNNVAGGSQAAKALAEAVNETGNVIVLQGIPGSSASRDRGAGFSEGIASFGEVTVVAEQTANFDRAEGLDVATNLLQANADVVGIFAENDEMALGALEALGARAGTEVMVVGFDGTADGLAAVESGKLLATIAQQPAELGKKAVQEAAKILKGETVDKEVAVEVVTVTSKNVADYQ